jgi:transcriptional regulator with XRE-family HTH domain
MSRHDEGDPARCLGSRLALLRTKARLSQEALGTRLGIDRTAVSRAENGDRPPTGALLLAWVEACVPADKVAMTVAGITSDVARVREGPTPTWFREYKDAEEVAASICIWQPTIVPGLGQTRQYADALLSVTGNDRAYVEKQVQDRMDRQEILTRDIPPEVMIIIDEWALRRLVGSRDIMAEQMRHLLDLTEMPHLSIQVFPSSADISSGSAGPMHIISVPGRADVVLGEAVKDVLSDTPALVARARRLWDRVRSDSLPRAASSGLIREVSETWSR